MLKANSVSYQHNSVFKNLFLAPFSITPSNSLYDNNKTPLQTSVKSNSSHKLNRIILPHEINNLQEEKYKTV